MKKIIYLWLLIVTLIKVHAQTPNVKQDITNPAPDMVFIAATGDKEYNAGKGIAVDKSGNIYVTGNYIGTANFGSINKTAKGGGDIFVAKYNKNGILQWVQSAGGTKYDMGKSIAVDENGHVYVIGQFGGTATFGTITRTAQGWADVFIARYSNNGQIEWVQTIAGMNSADGIALDKKGNIYMTGTYYGGALFGKTKTISNGGYDIFVAQYTSAGALQWVQSAGGPGDDKVYGIALDSKENVYITGNYSKSATFGSIVKTSEKAIDIYVARLDPAAGDWSWVQSASGHGTTDQSAYGIAIDANDFVYITGYYNGSVTFGSTEKTTKSELYYADIFVAGYDSMGNMQWVESAGGAKQDYGLGIAVDYSGNIYITGSFGETATFGSITKTALNGMDFFIAKYDPKARNWVWVQSASGTGGINTGRGIAVDSEGRAHITGQYSGTCNFGKTIKTAKGDSDIFVVKLAQ